ncbi:YcxB family protein [Clostridium sp. YIM B02505]|uniref:YcxB family protein n=1 Tax=Clostridium yunnanense TaxID=2800325 RepID=A0ABS1EMH4_9CLOT|nr:YcxB family protein [Clostridium yunnanense]MBK1810535.1 YcxB family protein [Clostridium yunnanense]
MNIEYTLSNEEFIEGSVENRIHHKYYKIGEFIENYILTFLSVLLLTLLFKENIVFFILLYIVCLLTIPLVRKKKRNDVIKKNIKSNISKKSICIKDDTILITSSFYEKSLTKKSIDRFLETDKYIHIYTNNHRDNIFIPKRIFEVESHKKEFLDFLNKYHQ